MSDLDLDAIRFGAQEGAYGLNGSDVLALVAEVERLRATVADRPEVEMESTREARPARPSTLLQRFEPGDVKTTLTLRFNDGRTIVAQVSGWTESRL